MTELGEGTSPRRVLITGATGFVGSRLAAVLDATGIPLTLVVRASRAAQTSTRVVAVGDIGPETDWSAALDDVRAVVHLAAHVHVAPERAEAEAERFDRVNRLGSSRLYEAAAAAGVSRFVFVSSLTVLGPASPPGGVLDDRSPPDPRTPYARSKLAAEIALQERAASGGPDLAILRPPLVAGPGVGGNLGSLARLARLPVPLPLGGLRNRRTLLSLDNLVAAIRAVLDAPEPVTGTFVLGDPDPVSTSDIVRFLREGAGRWPCLLPAPAGLLRAGAGWLGRDGAAERLLGDCAVDSSGFRGRFGFSDVTTTADSLRAAGRAAGPAG